MIVFYSVLAHEAIPLRQDLCLCASAIPDKETIRTPDGGIGWVHHDTPIDDIVELMRTVHEAHRIISTTEIVRSHSPANIGKEIPPSTRHHMDMDESSLAIMEMDAICRENSLSHIAPRYLFHVGLRRKIKRLAIDIHREIGMVMCYIGSWGEDVGREYADNYEQDAEKVFSHRV